MSIKENLTGEQFVQGNLKNFLQSYHIDYYPPEANYPTDKIWLYLHGKENNEPRMIRSLCFKNPENHRKFILNNIYAQLYLLEKRGIEFKPSEIDIHTYRKRLLDALLVDLRKKILEKYKEKIKLVSLSPHQNPP